MLAFVIDIKLSPHIKLPPHRARSTNNDLMCYTYVVLVLDRMSGLKGP